LVQRLTVGIKGQRFLVNAHCAVLRTELNAVHHFSQVHSASYPQWGM